MVKHVFAVHNVLPGCFSQHAGYVSQHPHETCSCIFQLMFCTPNPEVLVRICGQAALVDGDQPYLCGFGCTVDYLPEDELDDFPGDGSS